MRIPSPRFGVSKLTEHDAQTLDLRKLRAKVQFGPSLGILTTVMAAYYVAALDETGVHELWSADAGATEL